MTEPPYDTGGGPPGFGAAPGTPPGYGAAPGTPPGFGVPGQTPWGDAPLAAANATARKRFLAVMAFFGVLLVVSVAGFVMTMGDRVREGSARIRDGIAVTAAPVTPRVVESEPPEDEGPVPKPVTYRGSGSKTIKIRRPESGDALVYFRGTPGETRLLTVTGLAGGQGNGFVIVSQEPYQGVRLLDITSHLRTTALKIEASGPWVVEIRSARSAKAVRGAFSGTGDSVVRYTGRAGTASIRGGSDLRAFTVMAYSGGFPRPIATAVGSFAGEKPWPAGPVLVEVQATGRWSVRVR